MAIRDISIVTTEDGSPHIEGGKMYATATLVDGFGIGYQAVVRVNLSDYTIEQTAVIFTSRGGAKHGDLVGHIVAYPVAERKLTSGTWGNGFGNAIDTHYASTTDDLLAGTWLVPTTKLNLPVATGKAAYDSFLVKDGALWRLAYTTCDNLSFAGSPFYSSLATSPDLSTWTLVRNDPTTPYEGSKFIKLSGELYIAAGTTNAARAYDKELNYLGTIDATFSGGTQTQPHPMIFEAAPTKAVMLTFDNNVSFPGVSAGFTWGRMVAHEATMTSDNGYALVTQPKSVIFASDVGLFGSGHLVQPKSTVMSSGSRHTGTANLAGTKAQVVASGFTGGLNVARLVQPAARISARGSARAVLAQPSARLAAVGTTQGIGSAQMRQPSAKVAARGITGAVGQAALRQPSPKLSAVAGGRASLAAPRTRVAATGTTGNVGRAALSQPRSLVAATGTAWAFGAAHITQPKARMLAPAVAVLIQPRSVIKATGTAAMPPQPGRTAWCFTPTTDEEGNVSGALTRWPDYPGHAMARTATATWVTSPTATYRMTGATDDSTPIAWSWDTVVSDFDAPQKKTMVSAYIGGVVPLSSTYRVSSGDAPSRGYDHDEHVLALRNHRQKFGRGRKARYLGFGLSGIGPMAIDSVEFELAVMDRRIWIWM